LTNDNGTLGAASAQGGHLRISSSTTVINTNKTLTLSGPGTIDLGGTIDGGTVTCVNGGAISGGTLNDVTLRDATLVGESVRITNSLTVIGSVHVNCFTLGCATSETLDGSGSLIFSSSNHLFSFVDGVTVTLGTNVTIGGLGVTFYPSPHGTASFINEGTIGPDAGGLFFIQMNMTNRNGTFSAGSGAQLAIQGVIDNSDSTLTLSGPGAIFPDRGTIRGGTLESANAGKLSGSTYGYGGFLDGVTLNADLDLIGDPRGYDPRISVVNGMTLNGTVFIGKTDGSTKGYLSFDSIHGTGAILLGASEGNYIDTHGGILDAGVTIHGTGGKIGNIVNYGTIAADGVGGGITLDGLSNFGTIEALNGGSLTCKSNPTNFSGGTLTGGVWKAFENSSLHLYLNSVLTTAAAAIVLDGPHSDFFDLGYYDILGRLTTVADQGSFTIQNGRSWTAKGTFNNQGAVEVDSGSTFTSPGTYLQSAGTTLLDAGTLAAALVDLEAGILSGSGTIGADVQNAAEIDIGSTDAAGLITITGDYTQTSAGVLSLKIGGYNPGTDFDQLSISGTATLDGTINISLLNGFVPTDGDSFQILTFTAVNGDFATYNGLDLGGGLSFTPVYDSNSLTLVAMSN
jgi:hypothetical protein